MRIETTITITEGLYGVGSSSWADVEREVAVSADVVSDDVAEEYVLSEFDCMEQLSRRERSDAEDALVEEFIRLEKLNKEAA